MTGKFTGQHMTAILVAFFGVVVVVNFTMAGYASSTFGGIVVENSYVASQHFNRWLDEARAEDRLGWDAVTAWRPDGRLAITVTGAPPEVTVQAIARHPLGTLPDRALAFQRISPGDSCRGKRCPPAAGNCA
jgi:nitrogen fixation protein FixH